jgi:molybdopterin-biosynthesis enzyme MoeA-like protein
MKKVIFNHPEICESDNLMRLLAMPINNHLGSANKCILALSDHVLVLVLKAQENKEMVATTIRGYLPSLVTMEETQDTNRLVDAIMESDEMASIKVMIRQNYAYVTEEEMKAAFIFQRNESDNTDLLQVRENWKSQTELREIYAEMTLGYFLELLNQECFA